MYSITKKHTQSVLNFDFVLQGSLYIKMKPIFSWLWSFNDIAFMHFWRTVFGQGRVGSGTAERQKSMKTMSDEAIYQENFGFRKTNMLSATAPWIPRMKYKDWKQKIVRCNPIHRMWTKISESFPMCSLFYSFNWIPCKLLLQVPLFFPLFFC